VDADGAWTADLAYNAYRPGIYTSIMAIATPAKNYQNLSVSGSSTKYYGFPVSRTPPASGDVKFSAPRSIAITGVSFGGAYVYNITDICREQRAKIKFVFSCGDKLEEAHLNGLQLNNLIKNGVYRLNFADMFTAASDGTESLTLIAPANSNEFQTLYQGGSAYETEEIYILPNKYSSMNNGVPVYTLPQLTIYNGDLPVSINLSYDFLPEHTYTFRFAINSLTISPTLTCVPWQDNQGDTKPAGGTTVYEDGSSETVLQDISLSGGWQDGGGGTETGMGSTEP